MVSISIDSTFNFDFASIFTKEGPRTSKTINFKPEAEDEVIRESVSHKLDRHLVNPSNKVWRDSPKIRTPTSPFRIGDYLRYTNEVKMR